MLDLLGIVFSSSIMFLVILRAIQLDALLPWFRPPRTGADSSGLRLKPKEPKPVNQPDDRASRRQSARDR